MKEPLITVEVKSQFMKEHFPVEENPFIWTYDVTISNKSDTIVQLLNRYWRVTEQDGRVDEVRGAGVVGLQPIIKPGRQFSYSSYCQLTTPQGTLEGHYEMQTLDEEIFLVKIPPILLTSPMVYQ